MSSFNVELEDGFEYQGGGDMVTAKFITINCFSMKHLDKVAPVKEIVMQAFSRMAEGIDAEDLRTSAEKAEADKKSDDDKSKVQDGKGMMSVIYMNCEKGDMAKLFSHMKKLLTSKICAIDDEFPFTGNHIDLMSPSDFEKLCGEYIGNFIIS